MSGPISRALRSVALFVLFVVLLAPTVPIAAAQSPFETVTETFRKFMQMYGGDRDKYQFSDSLEPVDLTFVRPKLGDVHFSIPRAYLAWKSNQRGELEGEPPAILAVAVYPSMKPWVHATKEELGRPSRSGISGNTIQVWIRNSVVRPVDEKRLETFFKLYKLDRDPVQNHGLLEFRAPSNGAPDVLIREEIDPKKNLIIRCISHQDEQTQLFHLCTASMNGPARLSVTFRFRRFQLLNLDSVEESVAGLVESFIVSTPGSTVGQSAK